MSKHVVEKQEKINVRHKHTDENEKKAHADKASKTHMEHDGKTHTRKLTEATCAKNKRNYTENNQTRTHGENQNEIYWKIKRK